MTEKVTGQPGRKLTASGQARAATLERHGYTGLDDPGRPGRPKGPAGLAAARSGVSVRTARRRLGAERDLMVHLGLSPGDLARTSLDKVTEKQALVYLPKEEARVLIKAAKRGRRVSAQKRLRGKLPAEQRVALEVDALIRLYSQTSAEGRALFNTKFIAFLRGDPPGPD